MKYLKAIGIILGSIVLITLYLGLMAIILIVASGHAVGIQIDPFVPHLIIY